MYSYSYSAITNVLVLSHHQCTRTRTQPSPMYSYSAITNVLVLSHHQCTRTQPSPMYSYFILENVLGPRSGVVDRKHYAHLKEHKHLCLWVYATVNVYYGIMCVRTHSCVHAFAHNYTHIFKNKIVRFGKVDEFYITSFDPLGKRT